MPIGIVVDGADSKTASVASGYAAQIIAEFNRRQLAASPDAQAARPEASTREVRVVFNPSLKAVNAMIPGLIASILLISIVVDHEPGGRARASARHARADAGHADHARRVPARQGPALRRSSPSCRSAFVAVVGRFWFGVPFNGNVITVALGLGLFMLTSIGIGLLDLARLARRSSRRSRSMMFVLIPTMVLSGFIFPIESMPATDRAADVPHPAALRARGAARRVPQGCDASSTCGCRSRRWSRSRS